MGEQGSRIVRLLALGVVSMTVLAALGSAGASAAPDGQSSSVTIGPSGYGGNALATGPDGSLWFTNNAAGSIGSIGRITPAGRVRTYPVPTSPSLPNGPGLFAIAAGPDGNMWFTGFYGNLIGRITPAGDVTTFPVPGPPDAVNGVAPYGIAAGPDGNLWFTMDFVNAIGRITPDGRITQFPIPAPGATGPTPITASPECLMCGYLITAGPDGALWFTVPAASRIGRITTEGVVTSFPVPTVAPPATTVNPISVADITSATDGSLWFTQPDDNQIGRITTGGVVTEFTIPVANSYPTMITPGRGRTLWFTNGAGASLGRLSPNGTITQIPLSAPTTTPTDITVAADGGLMATVIVQSSPADLLQVARIGTGTGAMLNARVTGTMTAGTPLTCRLLNTSGWRLSAYAYQWHRDGRAIPGQTRKTYTPPADHVGTPISCRVSVTTAPMLTQLGVSSPAVVIPSR